MSATASSPATAAPRRIDGDQLADALTVAHLPSLLPTLGLLTGRPSDFAHLHPRRHDMLHPQGGMSAAQQAETRNLAQKVIMKWAVGEIVPPTAGPALLAQLLGPILGPDLEDYLPLALEELALHDPDPRKPSWTRAEIAPQIEFTVAVVGAGMSGLLAAQRLVQAGIEVVVLEKNPGLGGTWYENSYPGCRVDVPSHLYTYSHAQNRDWVEHFSSQSEVLASLRGFAAEARLNGRIRFGVEVERVEFHEGEGEWRIFTRGPDSGPQMVRAKAVIHAVGQLNRPALPAIPGRDSFGGPAFHSADWDHSVDTAGRRVAVIGTGASALQFVPALTKSSAAVSVFQRTPPWLIPTPNFTEPVDPRLRWLLGEVPGYQRWFRFWLLRGVSDAMLRFATVDPAWRRRDSVSAANHRMREALQAYLESQFDERPDLLAKVLPDYPPFAKRAIRDDGSWAAALKQPHVNLITDGIEEITSSGIRTSDGRHREFDVIVYGTGFQASRFLTPMRVIGKGGLDLHEAWAGSPSAYLGITVPGFPNMFMLYGPNTNIVVNGSAIYFTECEMRHVLDCLRLCLERDGAPVEVTVEAHDSFRARMDAENARRAWGISEVTSWYKSANGRVTQNWPLSVLEFWRLTAEFDPTAYSAAVD
jgi:4-hydroxyacetophenone monooxygenase